jgi:nifR3 family TIM-barrel protein
MSKRNFWSKLKKPFLALAPMEDVTDFVFREILAEIAPPNVFFTEFTNADGLVSAGQKAVIKRLKYSERQRPIVAQLWGNNPEAMKEATRLVEKLGFDGIDINMGCPDKAVVKIGAGSALIENPELARKLIEATKLGAPSLPISVKTRIGFNIISTEPWIKFLLEQELACITIHGRTKKQMSKVPTNWDEVGKAVKIRDDMGAKTLIVGNGDVISQEDALEKVKKYGVDGVMIGRGIFANPWIFTDSEKKVHSVEENLDLLLKHTELFVNTWGDEKPFHIMKKFFKVYVKGFDGANELRQKLMECENLEEVRTEIDTYIL